MEKNNDVEGKLSAALKELHDAREAYDRADEAEKITASAKNSAINRLNRAQQSFDVAFQELKKTHGVWDSDWAVRHGVKVE